MSMTRCNEKRLTLMLGTIRSPAVALSSCLGLHRPPAVRFPTPSRRPHLAPGESSFLADIFPPRSFLAVMPWCDVKIQMSTSRSVSLTSSICIIIASGSPSPISATLRQDSKVSNCPASACVFDLSPPDPDPQDFSFRLCARWHCTCRCPTWLHFRHVSSFFGKFGFIWPFWPQ